MKKACTYVSKCIASYVIYIHAAAYNVKIHVGDYMCELDLPPISNAAYYYNSDQNK